MNAKSIFLQVHLLIIYILSNASIRLLAFKSFFVQHNFIKQKLHPCNGSLCCIKQGKGTYMCGIVFNQYTKTGLLITRQKSKLLKSWPKQKNWRKGIPKNLERDLRLQQMIPRDPGSKTPNCLNRAWELQDLGPETPKIFKWDPGRQNI